MRRLIRWSFNGAAALSALLCLATCVLWVRSYAVAQFAGWSRPVQWYGMLSMCGILRLERGDYAADPPGWSYLTYPIPAGDPSGLWSEITARDRAGGPLRQMGFAYARIDYGSGAGVRRALYLPHWFPAVLLALFPALRLWKTVRGRRRSNIGLCAACGYDLRATPDRCPECGAVPAAFKLGGAA